jgi:hypothetical protein
MPSLLSYRFEQLLHENAAPQKSPCRLLAIRLYVADLESEKTFYANLLGCIPQPIDPHSTSFPLANGIRLVLVQICSEEASSKKGFLPAAGQIELELETRELMTIWKNLTASFTKGREWISLETQQMLRVLSPTGLLLTLRQKMFG